MEKLRLDFYLSVGGKLVAGDNLDHSSNCPFKVSGIAHAGELNTPSDMDKHYHITSFADRNEEMIYELTGDVPVIVKRGRIKTWRPDYEALLKMQAEHDKHNEPIIKACDEANKKTPKTSAEKTLSILGYRDLGGELWKPPLGKPHAFEKESEMVYTQEMFDNNIAPKVGMKCEVKYSGGGTFSNAIIKFISDYGVVHADAETGVEIFCGSINALDINPYKTQEQIELEEARQKQLEDMRFKYKNLPLEVAMQMQENGDLPEIVLDDLSARGMAKE